MGSRTKSLHGQEIMTLESLPEINQLYSTMDLDFRPQVAGTAIGTLVTRAITTMRQPMPQALPVLVVANWNARSAGMNNEMMASRALVHSKTMRDIAGVTAHYSHAPWYMCFCFQPSQAQQPVPKRVFQTYIHDEAPGPRTILAATIFQDYERLFCDDAFLRQTLHDSAGSFGLALIVAS